MTPIGWWLEDGRREFDAGGPTVARLVPGSGAGESGMPSSRQSALARRRPLDASRHHPSPDP